MQIERIARIRLAQEFGWPLEYIDKLDPFDLADIMGVLDGDKKVEAYQSQTAAMRYGHAARRGRRR